MGAEFDEKDDEFEPQFEEVDWDDIRYREEIEKPEVVLDAKDYLALFIAAMQTIFLPLVILAVFLVLFGFFFSLLF